MSREFSKPGKMEQSLPFFPRPQEEERLRLERRLETYHFPAIVTRIPGIGYVADNKEHPMMTGVSTVLLDVDNTEFDRYGSRLESWDRLKALGLPRSIIEHCYRIARVKQAGVKDPPYSETIEAKLQSYALDAQENGIEITSPAFVDAINKMRDRLYFEPDFYDAYPMRLDVGRLYVQTVRRPPPFPDALALPERIRDAWGGRVNVGIMTKGLPDFQIAKAKPLLLKAEINRIIVTAASKGETILRAREAGVFESLPVLYPGGQVTLLDRTAKVILIDDNAQEASEFCQIPGENGLPNYGALRLVRHGVEGYEKRPQVSQDANLIEVDLDNDRYDLGKILRGLRDLRIMMDLNIIYRLWSRYESQLSLADKQLLMALRESAMHVLKINEKELRRLLKKLQTESTPI